MKTADRDPREFMQRRDVTVKLAVRKDDGTIAVVEESRELLCLGELGIMREYSQKQSREWWAIIHLPSGLSMASLGCYFMTELAAAKGLEAIIGIRNTWLGIRTEDWAALMPHIVRLTEPFGGRAEMTVEVVSKTTGDEAMNIPRDQLN